MNSLIAIKIKSLLEQHQIPYLDIQKNYHLDTDLTIKVYFPDIIKELCLLFHEIFTLEAKEKILIKRDQEGYHKINIYFKIDDKKIGLTIKSMLKHTWA